MTETETETQPFPITPETTMGKLLEQMPGARRALFTAYHIGGCSSCGFSLEETLAEVCERNEDLPVADVIAYLQQSAENDARLQIAPEDLAARLEAGADLALLDIRSPEEHEAVRIPGSTLFTEQLMQEIMGTWPKEREFILYDHRGERVLDAVAFFTGHGFAGAKGLAGGIDLWSQRVDPDLPRYFFD
jgi:rhodanese-related sulfurtransferase